MFVGVLSALLVIPQVRAIAGGILASSAVIGLVIGFAAQRTIGNAIAGILIAFSQPLRLGDRVVVDDTEGTVEEIGLDVHVHPRRRRHAARDPEREACLGYHRQLHDPNPEKFAEITVQVPLEHDLDALLEALRAETNGDVFVSSLEDRRRDHAARARAVARGGRACRARPALRAHRRLRAAGVFK